LEELNQGIFAMISLNQSNALLSQLTQGSALIGKEVTWNDPDTGVEQAGEVTSVKIENGLPFLSVDGQDVPLAAISEINGEAVDDGAEDEASGDDEESGA
ncbi:MAG: flagellar hook assembly protein FlgD, partial [Planctomycetota bacterium]